MTEAMDLPDTSAGATAPGPSSVAEVRRVYPDAAVFGFLTYGVGAVTAFLAVALSLSDAAAGLHSSAMAVGIVAAGLFGNRLDRWMGPMRLHYAALALLAVAMLLIVWAAAFAMTLLGAALVGLGVGILLVHANVVLTAGGGSLARMRLARASLISTVSSLTVALFIDLGVSSGFGWSFVAVPALVLVLIAIILARGRTFAPPSDAMGGGGRLPLKYWTAWLLVAIVAGIEFVIVFWGGTLVSGQAEVTLATATLVVSALSAGIIVGRLALSLRSVSERDPIWIIRGSVLLALTSALMAWVSTSFEFSMAAFFVAGLSLASLFPLAAALTMATVPLQAPLASARLVLATGSAALVAPFLLGVLADITGVVAAWLLIPALCIVALALTVPISRARLVESVGPDSA